MLSFFTIQSNILCGVVAAQLALRPDRDGRMWRPLHLAALCGIAVTGIVYSAVLADIHEPQRSDRDDGQHDRPLRRCRS